MISDNFLLLYSHCIIVKGAARSTICDLQRRKIYPIPNAFGSLFEDGRYLDLSEISQQLDDEGKEILKEYIDFIEENELAFFCSSDELQLFPKMSTEWLFPAHISHCILDGRTEISYFDDSFLKQLETLCCNFIQFRFFDQVSWQELERIMNFVNPSQIKSVEIIMPFNQEDEKFYEKTENFVQENNKISNVTITGTSEHKIYKEGEYGMGFILQTDHSITGEHHCGVVHSSLFSVTIPTFTESLSYNSCLNRKLSVDADGNIKNCPSMKKSFGNISTTQLYEAAENPEFRKYWKITKDEIIKCKDCEFRYVCTDCRAYLEDPDNIHSAPLKCGYDPYSCEWRDWSADPMKEKSIRYYEMKELTIPH